MSNFEFLMVLIYVNSICQIVQMVHVYRVPKYITIWLYVDTWAEQLIQYLDEHRMMYRTFSK